MQNRNAEVQVDEVKQDVEKQVVEANERAERAEEELAALKDSVAMRSGRDEAEEVHENAKQKTHGKGQNADAAEEGTGLDQLRKDPMMAHLLDSLEAKKDIGHYGRLVFCMAARHFLTDEELISWLQKDSDFSAEAAASLLHQVEGRNYNPPKRERIMDWQMEQSFPIIPNPEDPDCGNLYKSLKFPDSVYGHIEQYQREKVAE